MTVLFFTQLFLEKERIHEKGEREEFTEIANTVIHHLMNMGFDEPCIRAAITSTQSLDVQTLVEMLVSEGCQS